VLNNAVMLFSAHGSAEELVTDFSNKSSWDTVLSSINSHRAPLTVPFAAGAEAAAPC